MLDNAMTDNSIARILEEMSSINDRLEVGASPMTRSEEMS